MEDNQLRNILKDSPIKASKHFTNRVMHQIEMEEALTPQKKRIPVYSPSTAIGVFGVMYGLIILTGWFLYGPTGPDLLESSLFLRISGLIASVCGFFYLISAFDDSKIDRRKSSRT